MTVLYAVTLAMLGASGLLVLVRLLAGPSALDRILALDVLSVLLVAGVLLDGARRQEVDHALAVTVALLGFVATITATRFLGPDEPPAAGEPGAREGGRP
jgi:multicomponent Na+:H+ antiporter subunit F